MGVQCIICLESCTASGTIHALYSTPCGHVMGKECLEKFKEHLNNNCFNCPFCRKEIMVNNCHPIHGFVPEVKNSVTKSENTCKKLKENFSFSKNFSENINGTIKIFDEHNGNILIAGEIPSLFFSDHFIKLIVTNGRKIYDISEYKLDIECSCLCFNKSENGVIEFCVGYINGIVELYRYKVYGNNLKVLNEKKLINFDFISILFGTRKINSVCFLSNDSIALSVGKGMIRNWNKREEWLSKTGIINKCVDNKSDYITQLKKTNCDDCLGIMNDKIFVFDNHSSLLFQLRIIP
uniref:RING-type domain-containing protein n=1 Tax=Strongyloides papillosus TaxID=174720 RepID=A0A0N5BIN6_STREA